MNYIIYHKADFDGYFSAVITSAYLKTKNVPDNQIYYVGYNYEDKIWLNKEKEFTAEIVTKKDKVFFVDCFKRDEELYFKLLENADEVIVIDHHQTTVEFFNNFSASDDINLKKKLEMIKNNFIFNSSERTEQGCLPRYPYSAAELCFIKFFGNGVLGGFVPKLISLISKYDIWCKDDSNLNWEDEILPFQFGLRSFAGIDTRNIRGSDATEPIINWLYCYCNETLYFDIDVKKKADIACPINIDFITANGSAILSYVRQRNKRIASFGKECTLTIGDKTWEDCYFTTDYCNNSMVFEDGLENWRDYEYLIILGPRIESESVKFHAVKCSIQIISGNENSNCADLCKMLGGGGHKAIGGCTGYVMIKDREDEKKKDMTIVGL